MDVFVNFVKGGETFMHNSFSFYFRDFSYQGVTYQASHPFFSKMLHWISTVKGRPHKSTSEESVCGALESRKIQGIRKLGAVLLFS